MPASAPYRQIRRSGYHILRLRSPSAPVYYPVSPDHRLCLLLPHLTECVRSVPLRDSLLHSNSSRRSWLHIRGSHRPEYHAVWQTALCGSEWMPPCPEIAGFLPTYASASDIEYSPAASWQKGSQVLSIPTAGQYTRSASALQPVQGSLSRFPDYKTGSPPESLLRSLPGNTPHLPLPDTKNQTDTACT